MENNPYLEEMLRRQKEAEAAPLEEAPSTEVPGMGNPYLEQMQLREKAEGIRTKATVTQALQAPAPDQTAKMRSLARDLGMVPGVVEGMDPETYRQAETLNEIQKNGQGAPTLLRKYGQDDFAKLAYDDSASLSAVERFFSAAGGKGVERGLLQDQVGGPAFKMLTGQTLTPEEQSKLRDLQLRMAFNAGRGSSLKPEGLLEQVGTTTAWLLNTTSYTTTQLFTGLPWALGGAGGGAVTGAGVGAGGALIAGQLGPQVAVPEEIVTVPAAALGGALTGGRYGYMAGQAAYNYRQEAGFAFLEYTDIRDENGHPMDPDLARGAAFVAGAVNAGLETVADKALAKVSIPGVDKLLTNQGKEVVNKLLATPGGRSALLNLGKKAAKAGTTEGITEVFQEATVMAGGESIKLLSERDYAPVTLSEVKARLGQAGLEGAVGGAGTSILLAPATDYVNNLLFARAAAEANTATKTIGDLQAAMDEAGKSKLIARDPEALREFIDEAAAESPMSTVYVSPQALAQVLEKREDATEILAKLGIENQLATAMASGSDIEIPVGAFITQFANSDLSGPMMEIVKTNPFLPSRAEMAILKEGGQEAMIAQAERLAQDVLNDETKRTGTLAVRSEMRRQLQAAGRFDAATNDVYADITSRGYTALADALEITPQEALERFPLQLASGEQSGELTYKQFVGERSADPLVQARLERAKDLEMAGASRDEIWLETMVYRGLDGALRAEIPDDRVQVTESAETYMDMFGSAAGRLSDLVDTEELDRSYPGLADRIQAWISNARASGYSGVLLTDPFTKRPVRMTVDAEDTAVLEDVIVHEIQHAIQQIEGTQGGGSATEIRKNAGLVFMKELRQEMTRGWKKYLASRAKVRAELVEAQAKGIRMADETGKIVTPKDYDPIAYDDAPADIVEKLKAQAAYEVYKRLAGETEARNTERRRNFSVEQRRAIPPWMSQDIRDEDQILNPLDGPARAEDGEQLSLEERIRRRIAKREEADPLLSGKLLEAMDRYGEYASPREREALGLPPRQPFAEWFAGSKVVDAQGNPLRVYRGQHGRSGGLQSIVSGFTFVEDAEVASTYALDPNDSRMTPQRPQVFAAFLSIKNPIFDTGEDPFADLRDLVPILGLDTVVRFATKYAAHIENTGNWMERQGDLAKYDTVVEALAAQPELVNELYFEAYLLLDNPEFTNLVRAKGYDGAIHGGSGESAGMREFRVFSVTQARSAYGGENPLAQGNRGEYRPSISEIRLTPNANLSTYLHEMGHHFLEVYSNAANELAFRQANGETLTAKEARLLDDTRRLIRELARQAGVPTDGATDTDVYGQPFRTNLAPRDVLNNPFWDDRLNGQENKAVEMRLNRYTVKEIADEMDVSDKHVGTLIVRAKKKGVDVGQLQLGAQKADIFFLKTKGLSNHQIAARVGTRPNVVASTLSQERRRLRELGVQDAPENAWLFSKSATESYAQAGDAPIYYSALRRAAANAKLTVGTAKQWLGTLKNTPGVKASEIEATGLEQYLALRNGANREEPYTKDEVVAFLDANGVQIRLDDNTELRWANMTLAGGTNYQETLLIMPPRSKPAKVTGIIRGTPDQIEDILSDISAEGLEYADYGRPDGAGPDGMEIIEINDFTPEEWATVTHVAESNRATLIETGRTAGERTFSNPNHYDVQNVLAHARFKTRYTADGRKVLAIEEIQSDWHQKGRKYGYENTAEVDAAMAALEDVRMRREAVYAELLALLMSPSIDEKLDGRDRAAVANAASAGFLSPIFAKQVMEAVFLTEAQNNGTFTPQQVARARELMKLNYEFDLAGAALNVHMSKVPQAPFKPTAAWVELVLKRMIRYAAENGFDEVAWIPGNVQNGKIIQVSDNRNAFYDTIVPGAANKLINRFGEKTGRVDLGVSPLSELISKLEAHLRQRADSATMLRSQITGEQSRIRNAESRRDTVPEYLADRRQRLEEMQERLAENQTNTLDIEAQLADLRENGSFLWQVYDDTDDGGELLGGFDTREEAEAYAQRLRDDAEGGTMARVEKVPNSVMFHSFRVNEQMRQSALNEGFALFQPAPGFFSALLRAVQDSKTKAATGKQWLATLKNTPGIKAEEIAWTGLEDWLSMSEPSEGSNSDGMVTKEELEEFLSRNGVTMKLVIAGGDRPDGGRPAPNDGVTELDFDSGETWDDPEAYEHDIEYYMGEVFPNDLENYTSSGRWEEFVTDAYQAYIDDMTPEIRELFGFPEDVELTPDTEIPARPEGEEQSEYATLREYVADAQNERERDKWIFDNNENYYSEQAETYARESYFNDDPYTIYEAETNVANRYVTVFGNSNTGFNIYYGQSGAWRNGTRLNTSEVYSYSEAQIQAEEIARDNDWIDSEPDPDDEDADYTPAETPMLEGQEAVPSLLDGAVRQRDAKWTSYQSPGPRSNYREFKLTLPEVPGSFVYNSHFADKNIVAFLRTTDRELAAKKIPPPPHRVSAPIVDFTSMPLFAVLKEADGNVLYEIPLHGRTMAEFMEGLSQALANPKDTAFLVTQKGEAIYPAGDGVNMRVEPLASGNAEKHKTFFIDEMQSDWHQKGRQGIYDTPEDRARAQAEYEKAMDASGVATDGALAAEANVQAALYNFTALEQVIDARQMRTYSEELYRAVVPEMEDGPTDPQAIFDGLTDLAKKSLIDAGSYAVGRLVENNIADRTSPDAQRQQRATEMLDRALGGAPAEFKAAVQAKSDAVLAQRKASERLSKVRAAINAPVANAPFKGDAWINLALKQAIIAAIAEGKTHLAWADSSVLKKRWSDRYAELYENTYDKKMVKLSEKLLEGKATHFENGLQTGMGYWILEIPESVAKRVRDSGFAFFQDGQKPDDPPPIPQGQDPLTWWNNLTFEQRTPMHEQFARLTEAYFMDGKAPTPELQGLFSQLRRWLLNVYRSIRDLNVDLSPEVVEIMDRMYAAQEDIATANENRGLSPLFSVKPDQMTDQEWEAYQRLAANAVDDAEEELTRRSLRDMKWLSNARSKAMKALQDQAKEQRKAVAAEVTEEVMSQPVNRARNFLRRGLDAQGNEVQGTHKLSIAALQARYPEGSGVDWSALGYGKYGMLSAEGLDPDALADILGYASGDELVRDLATAPSPGEAIRAETDARMLERYGDLASPKDMERAADEAVHSGLRSRVLSAEYAALAKATGKPDKMLYEAAKGAAKQIVGRMIASKLSPQKFVAAAKRAGRLAETAMRKGDLQGAATAKRDQMLNFEISREIQSTLRSRDKALNLFKKVVTAKRDSVAKSRNYDIVQAARAILSVYGMGRMQNDVLSYLTALKTYDPVLYASLEPTLLGAMTTQQTLDQMSVDKLMGLHDVIQQLWSLSREEKQIEIDGQKVELQSVVDELNQRLEDLGADPAGPPMEAATEWQKTLRRFAGMAAGMRRVESWARHLDGGKVGPFTRMLFRPVSQAADAYRVARNDYVKQFRDLFRSIEAGLGASKIAAPELKYTFRDKSELLHAILHTGNKSNLRKLLLGRGWGSETPDGAVDTTRWDDLVRRLAKEGVLTKADFDFAQGVWDLLDRTKPVAQAAHRRVFGRYFSEITADEVQSPFGTYRGGYVPAIYDDFYVQDATLRAEQDAIENSDSTMFPTPASGFTKSRVDYNQVLALDLRLMPQHLDKVLKFAYLAGPVRDVLRVLRNKGFSKMLESFDPTAQSDMLLPWLQRAARQIVDTPTKGQGGKAVDGFFRAVRSRSGMGLMFANLVNVAQQVSGFSLAALQVKPHYLAGGLVSFMRNPSGLTKAIRQASPMMADRGDNQLAQMYGELEKIIDRNDKFGQLSDWFQRHAYWFQTMVQNVMDTVIWKGAYDQGQREGMTERQAAAHADAIVRQTQGSVMPEDISRVESGSPFFRSFVHMYGYFNMWGNLLSTEFRTAARDMGLRKGAGRMLYIYLMGFAAPALIAELIAQGLRGQLPEDEDEDGYLDEYLAWLVAAQAKTAIAFVPLAGQPVNAAIGAFTDVPYDDRVGGSPAISAIESVSRTPANVYDLAIGEGDASRTAKDGLMLLTLLTGIPFSGLGRPITYALDVAEGDIEPTSDLDYARGLATGAASEASR